MKKEEIEDLFRDMMLKFVRSEYPKFHHWKIPNEDCVIRIEGGYYEATISIRKSKRFPASVMSADVGIAEIQKLIQKQMDAAYFKLYCTGPGWYDAIYMHHLSRLGMDISKFYYK